MSSTRSTNLGKTLTKYGLNLIRKMAAFINFVQHWLKENTIGQAAKNISGIVFFQLDRKFAKAHGKVGVI